VRIDLGPLVEGLSVGDSVAVAGACLTVANLKGSAAEFDVVAETLSRTTLGSLTPAARVNLERPLRLGDPIDGHLVQGHVDGVAKVLSVTGGGQHVVEFAAPAELTGALVPKGSITVNGVSLTLLDVAEGQFSIALIPSTLARTTLGSLATGAKVNVETDIIGKYVRRYLQGNDAPADGLTLEKLKETGFVS